MRMQQAGRVVAEAAAAKAVAIGQKSASMISSAVARANWRLAQVMDT